ncbi:MAG TPA: DUF4129 domain-containing protein [Candidatus Limnocylindria bacterium]
MRASGAVALLIGARCFVEAVTFAALAAIAHAGTAGRDPMPVMPAVLALFGAALLLATILREAGTERRSATVLVVTLAASAAWGLALPMHDPDGLAVLSRVVVFGILGEAFLWRVLTIARGALRWTDARNAAPVAAIAIAIAIIGPWNVDRAPFAPLALLVVAISGLALSLARTTEELALARGTRGGIGASTATGATVVLALVAIVASVLVPSAQDALSSFGTFLAPIVERILYLLILPFAYIAAALIEALRPLIRGQLPQLPQSPFAQQQGNEDLQRQIEAARPYVFGAFELVIVAIAALIAVVLLERMLVERRMGLPIGVTLERESAEGISLMDTLRSLRPRRRAHRVPPHDDGSRASALRVIYWRFLALAERRGPGWREDAETPREHVTRIGAGDASWSGAAPIVSAFEALRYGEREPDDAVLDEARASLRTLEARARAAS